MRPAVFPAAAGLVAAGWSTVLTFATGEHGVAVAAIPLVVGVLVAALVSKTMPWAVRTVQVRPVVPDAGIALLTSRWDAVDERWASWQTALHRQERAA